MNVLQATETVASGQEQQRPAAPALTEAEKASRGHAGRRLLGVGALAAVVLGGALVGGTLPRLQQERKVHAAAAQASTTPPRVTVAVARRGAGITDRVLPGNSLPLLEASLYARSTGYIKERLVDIGDRVKQDQLLAVIAAPDIDDQLAQARANLTLAKANLRLSEASANVANIIYERDLRLGASLSQQKVDKDRATAQVTKARVEAARASVGVNESAVQRYTDLQGFEKIVAPFPGVITARRIDPGDLVAADSTTLELFHLMRTDVLRVFVSVPQLFATGIKVGQRAVVYLRDEPHKQYPGKVTRTANALDPNTRTLLTQVDVPNPDDTLRPGMYLQVKFVFDRTVFPIRIPAAALVVTSTGRQQAGVLDGQHRVRYRTVQLGRDYGADIEVLAGLKEGETVVVHPGDDLPEGTMVEPVTPKKPGT